MTDKRFTITKEFTGHLSGKPQWVVRFMGEYVGSDTTKKGAADFLARYQAGRNGIVFTDNAGAIDVMNNPARRIGTARPRRVSQLTKKPPTKRLVARRKKNTDQGYFPNPKRIYSGMTNAQIEAEIQKEFPRSTGYKADNYKYAIIQSSNKGNEIICKFIKHADAEMASALFNKHAAGTVTFFVEAI